MTFIKVLELFGGIGACSKALERLGIEYEITDYVEIDKYAVKSFNAIHNTNFEPQDICEWDKDIEVDLIMHGSPCQDFSLAGKQAGGDEGSGTRSSLMYETIRIVEKLKPKYVIWENVKNLLSKKHIHNFNAYLETMEKLGYTNYYQVLNAKDYGIPQNRERVFTISIRKDINKVFTFPQKQELKLKLKDMLEDEVDEKYYLSEKMIKYISATGTANFKNPDCKINLDIARPLTTDQNKRAGTTNYISEELPNNCDLQVIKDGGIYKNKQAGSIYNKNGLCPTITTEASANWNILLNECPKIRKLTPKECWRLMGFDDKDYEKAAQVNSNTQLYKQAGNSIVINVLMHILFKLFYW
jgi:DNA (cytosine-5)-methyltransferase 1